MSRKQGVLVIAGFLLAFGLGGLLRFPAERVLGLASLPSELRAQGVRGSVVEGRIAAVHWRGMVLQQLRYRFLANCLIRLRVCVHLQSSIENLEVIASYSILGGEIRLDSSHFSLPTSVFDQMPHLLVKPRGEFLVRIGLLRLSKDLGLLDLSATVDWQAAGVHGEEQILGDYRAELNLATDGIEAILSSNPESLLRATGDVNFNWQGSYKIDVKMQPRDGLSHHLRGLLDSLTRKSGIGSYQLRKAGQLAPGQAEVIGRFKPKED